MSICLHNLSEESLLKIFEYCSICDLCNLKETCLRFYYIINSATQLSAHVLVANSSKKIVDRTNGSFPVYERWRISFNWCSGKYKETSIIRERKKYMPWLVLTKYVLWLSRGTYIQKFNRQQQKIVADASLVLGDQNVADVCRFVYKNNYLISGQTDGSIFIWKENANEQIYIPECHRSDIHAVDLEDNVFVTGSRDNHFKVWPLSLEPQNVHRPLYNHEVEDRVWSTAIYKEKLAVGTSGCHSVPLQIFDLNRCATLHTLGKNLSIGSGILDIKWQSPYILLSCGYDTNVRKWDLRSGTCVQAWEDPCNSRIYCLDVDNRCTILTGTESYGRVVLWDSRQNKFVQMYFLQVCRSRHQSSPIYSLSFDANNLFTATQQHLSVLDFSVKNKKSRDYSNCFSTEITVNI